jgi:hypothetical protein
MDFTHFTEEQREEWRRSEVTTAALSMLREAETVAAKGVIRAAESSHDPSVISQTAGYRLGLEKAIDLLTRNHEKPTG